MHKINKMLRFLTVFVLLSSALLSQSPLIIKPYSSVSLGAQQFEEYLPYLKNKKVGIVTNITGVICTTSIVDTLLKLKVNIKKIFGPEHGFRSEADAGQHVKNHKDPKTGISVISLYGSNKKPTKEQLKNIDVLIYDIQDVGVRFYTYISTMCYAMEACAENNKELIVLDRPNPNGFYIDGPVLDTAYRSFLGLHSVPIVYGMTCGEYALMVNEEGWLKNKVKCKLRVVKMKNYDRNCSYELPAKPSPNLPNMAAVLMYPGLGLFEGTMMSLGRGTSFPFQALGHPAYTNTTFSFMPLPSSLSKTPRYVNQVCFGVNLRTSEYLRLHPKQIDLNWLLFFYGKLSANSFFEDNFNYHAGNNLLKKQIQNGLSEEEIRSSWVEGIENFKQIRKKYLLYPDFN